MTATSRILRDISPRASGVAGSPGPALRILAASILLILSFPGPDIGLLALVALVPLLDAVSGAGRRQAFLRGYAAGTVWFFFSYGWVSNSLSVYGGLSLPAGKAAILILALIHGFYPGFFAAVVPGLQERPVPVQILVLPSVWVLLELARSWFPAPFPWLLMGSSLWKTPVLKSLYPVAGVYGASFWIVAVNVLLWSFTRKKGRTSAPGLVSLAVVASLPLVLAVMPQKSGNKEVRVGIVQGNYRQELKWEESLFEETIRTYLEYTARALEQGASLVVWPETAVTSYYQAEPELRQRLRTFAEDHDVHLVFGSPGFDLGEREILLYNRVYHLSPGGEEDYYDKVRLVPFGEYIPFFGRFTFVDRLVPGEGEFARGKWTGPFSTPVPAGALVCYEISFPGMARKEVSGGSGILINVTNDSWFGHTWGPYQHLAIAAVRAAENGVPVIRAANTGISAIIDNEGRIVEKVPLGERGLIVADVRTGGPATIYTRAGDWIVTFSAAVIILFVSITIIPRRKPGWTGWTDLKTIFSGQKKDLRP